jgi:ATP-dependent DNA helicase RecQ
VKFEKFCQSPKLELVLNIIKDFEETNQKYKYKTDLEVFIRESKIEDFFGESGEIIFVSTIHKVKGKEFDNVFLMLDNFNPFTDKDKRLLYVAITRAKNNLIIYYNGNYLEGLKSVDLERVYDDKEYLEPSQLVMHLTYKDVWLTFY